MPRTNELGKERKRFDWMNSGGIPVLSETVTYFNDSDEIGSLRNLPNRGTASCSKPEKMYPTELESSEFRDLLNKAERDPEKYRIIKDNLNSEQIQFLGQRAEEMYSNKLKPIPKRKCITNLHLFNQQKIYIIEGLSREDYREYETVILHPLRDAQKSRDYDGFDKDGEDARFAQANSRQLNSQFGFFRENRNLDTDFYLNSNSNSPSFDF